MHSRRELLGAAIGLGAFHRLYAQTAPEPSLDLLAVHEALERFQEVDATAAQIVKLRYFAGFTIPQAAEALGISTSTADRSWAYARAWLHAALKQDRAGRE